MICSKTICRTSSSQPRCVLMSLTCNCSIDEFDVHLHTLDMCLHSNIPSMSHVPQKWVIAYKNVWCNWQALVRHASIHNSVFTYIHTPASVWHNWLQMHTEACMHWYSDTTTHVHAHACTCTMILQSHISTYGHTCTYTNKFMYTYSHTCSRIYTYTFVCIYTYICVCIYMYIYIHAYI